MSNITLSKLKNSTEESRQWDEMRQYPPALRKFFAQSKAKFDRNYDNRKTNQWIQRTLSTKYPIQDRTYGSPNEDICNIFYNLYNDKEINQIIEDYTFERRWIYHPVRSFEKWTDIARNYYRDDGLFWLILVFNRITDPFQALLDFNIVRIPNIDFLQELPYSYTYDFTSAQIS